MHLLSNGFTLYYIQWYHHGEPRHAIAAKEEAVVENEQHVGDPILNEVRKEEQIEELFAELKAELYLGCKEFLSLSFLIFFMYVKVMNH